MAVQGNAETLERLLIEVVGDDSKLRSALEDSIKAAQDAAKSMREALSVDFSNLTQGAKQATSAVTGMTTQVGDFGKVFEAQLAQGERAFEKIRNAGEKTEEQFEEYRRTILETIESQRPLAQAVGVNVKALDDLTKRVREAKYQQSEKSKEDERSKQAQEELEAVIKRLSNEVRASRNVWAGRITSDEEFRESTMKSREEILKLLPTLDRSSAEYRKLSQELAYAQRGLDSVNKVASRGGLAWTTQIALTNQFGQALRGMGPAGNAAATGLGFMEGGLNRLIPRAKEGDSVFRMFGLTTLRFAAVWYPVASALIPLVGTGLLAKLSADAAKAASELEAATFRTGLTIEGLQELQHAARVAGVPMELLSTTMQRLQRRAADANAGNKGLRQSFDALGVSLTGADGKMRSTEDLLGQVADGLNKVENNADRLALAFKIFDTEGGRLLPLLSRGSEGIRELREEARRLGLVVSGDTVMSLAELDSKIQTVMQQFSVLRMEVAGAFLPVMENGLLPLVSDKLVPALQTAAGHIQEFSERFFDATEAGEAFRADTVKNLQAIVVLGKGVVAGAQAVWGAVNAIVGAGAAAFGAGQGLADWQENNELILARRADLLRQIAYMEGQLKEDWAAPGTLASVKIAEQLQRARRDLANLPANVWEAMEQGARNAGEVMVGNAIEGFTSMMDTLQTDVTAQLEALLAGVDFTRPARRAGRNAGDGFGNGFGDGTRVALEGSLKHAQEQLAKAQEELAYAVGPEARAAAQVVVEAWQEAVRLIQLELEAFDPAKAAKAWVSRLTAELRFGMKDAATAFDLVNPRLEELREEAAQALSEFGIDSDEYLDTLAKLEVLEAFIKSIKDEASKVDASGLLRSVGAGFAMPESGADPTAGLVEGLQLIMRIEQAEAQLEGRALNVGEHFAWMLPILEDQMDEVARGSALWFTIAGLINQIRGDVAAIDVSDLLRSAGDGFALPQVDKSVGESLVEGFELIIRTEEALAGMRGEAAKLSTTYEWMVEILDEHAATLQVGSEEWLRVVEAANKYRALIDDLPEFSFGGFALPPETKTATQALRENHEWLLRMAAAQDVLAGTQTDLTSTYSMLIEEQRLHIRTLKQGTDEWLEAVETLARYEAGLKSAVEGQKGASGSFDAWAAGVARLGVELDPVSLALADLAVMFDKAEIDAEQFAAGVDMVYAAMDRLEQAEAAAEVKKITEAWEAAEDAIDEFLGQAPTEFNELRKAAEDAFKAGVIGADELRDALKAIGVMEVVSSLRQLGSELGGAGGIIPNLAADLTRAAAQFGAGNRTAAIATAFQAATTAVEGLGDAFEDTANRGEAMLDLVIGGAAALATILGGPALGQAVGAVGQFVKSVLGDLRNGLVEIEKQIKQTITSSRYLGEELIRGLADSSTRQVSRGGLLGLLGFTKAQLDEDAFRAGISVAENLAQGMVNTLRSGDFEEAWKAFIDDVIVTGLIESFMATALVQDALAQAMELIMAGDASGGAAALDRLKNDFHQVWQTIQSITSTPLPDPDELERSVLFSLPDATVSVLAAPQWALELGQAATRMSEAGTAMLSAAEVIRDTFDDGIHVSFEPSPRGIDAARSL